MCFWERKKMKSLAFLLHISHAISCCNVKVTDLYIGWSKEMMNTTTELLTYCTVQCIFDLSCVMLKLLKDKPVVSYRICFFVFSILKSYFSFFSRIYKNSLQKNFRTKSYSLTVVSTVKETVHVLFCLCVILGIWGL